jgi:hypothetical protein
MGIRKKCTLTQDDCTCMCLGCRMLGPSKHSCIAQAATSNHPITSKCFLARACTLWAEYAPAAADGDDDMMMMMIMMFGWLFD